MDLATVKPNEAILEIVHPGTGEKLGIKVGVLSIDDERLKKIKRRIQDDRINLEKRGKAFTAEQIAANQHLLLFSAMTFWTWEKPLLVAAKGDEPAVYGEQPSFNGADQPTFNQQTVLTVFEQLPWFADQINEKVGETKSFFTA